jgi:UDP-glucose 4-epimerase
MKTLSNNFTIKDVDFPIQGTGEETRSFCYIDDAIEGILLCTTKGKSREIYHIGTEDEIKIADLVKEISGCLGLKIKIKEGKPLSGGTKKRCPGISKIKALGYDPMTSLKEGLMKTIAWYSNDDNVQSTVAYEGVTR